MRIPSEVRGYRLTAVEPVQGFPAESLYRFAPPDSLRATVTVLVYPIPPEVRGADARAEWANREGRQFQKVLDIQLARGVYTDVKVAFAVPDTVTSGTASVPGFMTVAAATSRGRKIIEMEFIMLVNEQFVKVRATLPAEDWQMADIRPFVMDMMARIRGVAPAE